MVIDTSALIAVLPGEPEAELFAVAIAGDPKRLISAFTALETGVVIEAKKGEMGGREWDLLIHQARIEIGRSFGMLLVDHFCLLVLHPIWILDILYPNLIWRHFNEGAGFDPRLPLFSNDGHNSAKAAE
jgi:ribonuclease VapC